VERLRETPKTLNEKSERLWGDLGLGSYGFDDRERVAAAVERIDREEWARYFSEQLSGAGRRALLLHTTGAAAPPAAGEEVPGRSVDTDAQWRADAKYYRFDWPVSVQDAERALHL
jgi:secreted Zn-dependent insulinase-like peptidase